jgi:circadian clock protein KaiB
MSQPTPPEEPIRLQLYIYGATTPNSILALNNLEAIRRNQPPGRLQIEVIDIAASPFKALADGILVTPTLAKISPLPTVQIIGNLSETATVLKALGLSLARDKDG